MSEVDLRSLPDGVAFDADQVTGYRVSGTDGAIGVVIKASTEPGRSYLVLSARPWLDATMVMLPAGLVERVDHDRGMIAVDVSRADVARAPSFAADSYQDGAYQAELAGHYLRARPTRAVH